SRTCFFFFQAEDGIRDDLVTGVQTCALPIYDGGKGNFWREPEDQVHVIKGHKIAAKYLAGGLLSENFDVAYAYKPLHKQLGHARSEEHTSELQSPDHLVCGLLLEKKNRPHRQ